LLTTYPKLRGVFGVKLFERKQLLPQFQAPRRLPLGHGFLRVFQHGLKLLDLLLVPLKERKKNEKKERS
jgi:hypothetical protein